MGASYRSFAILWKGSEKDREACFPLQRPDTGGKWVCQALQPELKQPLEVEEAIFALNGLRWLRSKKTTTDKECICNEHGKRASSVYLQLVDIMFNNDEKMNISEVALCQMGLAQINLDAALIPIY